MKKKVRILSIDGGGIRGIIPAKILVKVEELLQEYSQDSDVKISSFFDLIAGTSTGSILGALYLCPKYSGSKEAKYSAKEILDLYLDHGGKIFQRSWRTKLIDYFGLSSPLYKEEYLEKMLKDYFEDLKLSDLLKPCLFPAYDIEHGKAIFFNKMNADKDIRRNFLVREVVRASTAAPTYFPIAKLSNQSKELGGAFIDGGLFANSPALCAYIEACKFPPQPTAKDIMILSLGTGCKGNTYPYQVSKGWGKVGWIAPVIDIYNSSASQTVDHQLSIIYQCHEIENQYFRIEADLKQYDVNPDMDCVTEENIKVLVEIGDKVVEENLDMIKEFTRKLYISGIGRQNNKLY